MNNVFELDVSKESQIKFNIGVAGSNNKPTSVRVVIGGGLVSVCLTCAPLSDSEWVANVPPLANLINFASSEALFSIEVVLNGRLFTPFKKSVSLVAQHEVPTVSVSLDGAKVEPPVAAIEEPKAAEEEEMELVAERPPKKDKTENAPISAEPVTESFSILKTIEPEKKEFSVVREEKKAEMKKPRVPYVKKIAEKKQSAAVKIDPAEIVKSFIKEEAGKDITPTVNVEEVTVTRASKLPVKITRTGIVKL